MEKLRVNHGKRLTVEVGGRTYARIPVKTHVITAADDVGEVVRRYAGPLLRSGDILVISEKVVAITQQRAYQISQIRPSWLARFLVRFVYKSPYGIGLGSPWTMELAIREAGVLRVIVAAIVAGVAKLFGVRGVFYRVCGANIAAIDGPCDYTIPPYNRYAILGPLRPNETAQSLSEATGVPVAIIDANDLGVVVLGVSSACPERAFLAEILADNPLGQSCEQTPIGILRAARVIHVRGGAPTLRRFHRVQGRC
ncbi:MAG: coenzyme F420-0:L-glutamate ligase [Clostridia bacterium]|nr:coenzyme F420-0:L-glutamate ligase [Clostridia bacterium]